MSEPAYGRSAQAGTGGEMSLRAANERLRHEIERRERIEHLLVRRNEQMLAAVFQRSMLPRPPRVPYLQMAVRYRPFQVVSGDVYDFVLNREGETGVFLGDATGHGLAAAFMTMMVHCGLDSVRRDLSTDATLARLNAMLAERPTGRSVSAVFFRLSPDGRLAVSHAGHPSLVIVPAAGGAAVTFMEGGCALGMFADAPVPYVEETRALSPGDTVFGCTDGALEWRAADGSPFGAARLLEYLETHRDLPLEILLDGLLAALQRHGPDGRTDDVSLFACRFRPPAAGSDTGRSG